MGFGVRVYVNEGFCAVVMALFRAPLPGAAQPVAAARQEFGEHVHGAIDYSRTILGSELLKLWFEIRVAFLPNQVSRTISWKPGAGQHRIVCTAICTITLRAPDIP